MNDVKKLKPIPAGFEVETVDGKVKEEQLEPENDNKSVDEPLKKKVRQSNTIIFQIHYL